MNKSDKKPLASLNKMISHNNDLPISYVFIYIKVPSRNMCCISQRNAVQILDRNAVSNKNAFHLEMDFRAI